MLPDSNEVTQKTPFNQDSHVSVSNVQHGIDPPNEQPTHQYSAAGRTPKPRRSDSNVSTSTTSSGSSNDSLERSLRGLRKCSPVDRITEHEKASSYTSKRRGQGPSFAVIQRGRSATTGQVALADFPNEVLTHVLSHLPPASLSDVSLVSHRFHQLVTTPHAWRIAFARYFPGAEALRGLDSKSHLSGENSIQGSERRDFSRLTALASWRSEYILRTRLLRSLARGKPAEASGSVVPASSRAGGSSSGSAHTTYNSDLVTIVDKMHAAFGNSSDKRLPRFIHGATDVGMASTSDPKVSKLDPWGFADAFSAQHFADVYPGDELYGLGAGDIVGAPNSMDVSQPYGMIYGEGLPDGRAYLRSTEEKRGRTLASFLNMSIPQLGIPSVLPAGSLTSVWIAKSSRLPELSEGLVGILIGSSQGILSLYSLGTNPLRDRRIDRGELTARWVISPAVPIVAIAVDSEYSTKRQVSKRIWAVVLNALGELFYLTDLPVRRTLDRASSLDDVMLEKIAWETGFTACWSLVEPTKRTTKPNPFDQSTYEGCLAPRTSWTGSGLSPERIVAETNNISLSLKMQPKHIRKSCHGWDMRRRLEVDFAASDENAAGEGIVVISCGLEDDQCADIKRFTRCMRAAPSERLADDSDDTVVTASLKNADVRSSVFGENASAVKEQPSWSFDSVKPRRDSAGQIPAAPIAPMSEDWRVSTYLLGSLKASQITTTAIDTSSFALMTITEDPLLIMNGCSITSSPFSSPLGPVSASRSTADVPGQRARLLAVGTKSGAIALWNLRAPTARNAALENVVEPMRIIHTDSPQISCLALTALYLLHGGNDGLVQAWCPLASSTDPIRTLNSRFSSRARRRLVQAEASPAGVGINLFAAGSICLDPDPTILRGMVSLGSHLRYFSYSSQATDQYRGNKRRLRRSERGSNQGGDRFSGTGRGALKDYIANEKLELEREKRIRRKEEDRLAGRYGVDLLGPGATEDEIMAYATLLSEESARDDEVRRKSASDDSSSDTVTEEAVGSPASTTREELDDDMAEAIRLSLRESNGFRASSLGDGDASASSFTVRFAKSKKSSPSRSPPRDSPSAAVSKTIKSADTPEAESADLDFVLQLSRAEEESRVERSSFNGKGKRRES